MKENIKKIRPAAGSAAGFPKSDRAEALEIKSGEEALSTKIGAPGKKISTQTAVPGAPATEIGTPGIDLGIPVKSLRAQPATAPDTPTTAPGAPAESLHAAPGVPRYLSEDLYDTDEDEDPVSFCNCEYCMRLRR